jgi:DnaJ family protein B protein 6
MDTQTYYEVLDISPEASEDDIRKAYRRQALLWHPDKNQHKKEEAETRFKLIAEAYEVLSDGDKRRVYDMYGKDGLKGGSSNGTYAHTMPTYTFVDPFELFAQIFGNDPFRNDPFRNGPFSSPLFSSPFTGGSHFGPFGAPGFGRPFMNHEFGMPMG